MLAIYASAAAILAASLIGGRAILALARWPGPAWLAGATGFAALVVVAPFLVRLPGRATTAAIVLALALAGAALLLARGAERSREPRTWLVGLAVLVITIALASLPFVFNERVGVLGEGIYTNDHAAQLTWADWLQHGFGPEPTAVSFGYPVGPQALAVIAAEATQSSLIESFNGLLIAIPALAGLSALSLLGGLRPAPRIAVAAIAAIPYLGASFLAQSAFKETAMGLLVLAFAATLAAVDRAGWRAVFGVGAILAVASVFTYSIPGLAWFVIAAALWLAAEALAGRVRVDRRQIRATLARNRFPIAIGAVAALAVAVLAIGPAIVFVERINEVQSSAGRLSSPVFPGEAFGIWPQGDFRIVRGEVDGALVATLIGALAVGFGALALGRRREWGPLAVLVAGALVYLGARLFAEIHVEAKALAVIAPLALLVALRALLDPGPRSPLTLARYVAGAVVAVAALASTLLALRAAPVGYDDRATGLEQLAERIEGESVVFLGLDRAAGYRLRGTLARAPAGYVPEEIASRPEKTWQQGWAPDFDTVEPGKLDKFDYAITTSAAYASAAPANFDPVAEEDDYVLWRRQGETPRTRVLAEGDAPGSLDCIGGEGERPSRSGETTVFAFEPELIEPSGYRRPPRVEQATGGQEDAFLAPATAKAELELGEPGDYELSLQYHSQVPLEVVVDGETLAELPPSLDGMYLDGAGQGAFWPAGELTTTAAGGPLEVELRAAAPSGLQDALGVERRVWLGELAATAAADPVEAELRGPCGAYIDHFRFDR